MYYICFSCLKQVDEEYTKSRVRCPYCGGKVLMKDRLVPVHVKAR